MSQLIKAACLFALLVFAPGCATRPPQIINEAVNSSPYQLRLLNIEQTVHAWKSFRPTLHVDTASPPRAEQITDLKVKELASQSAGIAITIRQNSRAKPVHAYLVLYPVYPGKHSPARYQIKISDRDIKQARRGQTVRLHGHYDYRGAAMTSWVMWLSNKSLDVDCGCS